MSNSSIKAQCDNLVSQIIKFRDPFCLARTPHCTHTTDDPAHVFGRRNLSTRWNLNAVIGCCRACHNYIDTNPEEKERVCRIILGKKQYEKLERLSKQDIHMLPMDYRELRMNLRLILKK